MVAFHAAVHDGIIALLLYSFLGNFMVYPVRIAPHTGVDFPKLHLTTRVVLYRLFECLIEDPIVKEDVGIMKPVVEMPLD